MLFSHVSLAFLKDSSPDLWKPGAGCLIISSLSVSMIWVREPSRSSNYLIRFFSWYNSVIQRARKLPNKIGAPHRAMKRNIRQSLVFQVWSMETLGWAALLSYAGQFSSREHRKFLIGAAVATSDNCVQYMTLARQYSKERTSFKHQLSRCMNREATIILHAVPFR